MENMVLQADKGIDCTEATGITFKNVKLYHVEYQSGIGYCTTARTLHLTNLIIRMALSYCSCIGERADNDNTCRNNHRENTRYR